jgi:hypothetical protein
MMLRALLGPLEPNYDLKLPCSLGDFVGEIVYDSLAAIHDALQSVRGYTQFVRSRKLPRVDFFVPSAGLIVEFDESQHFTAPRGVSLRLYQPEHKVGFSIATWYERCLKLNKRDNDPPFRDEQRAWYDSLRDFAPVLIGGAPTVRLYSADCAWCSLDPSKVEDIQTFDSYLKARSDATIS